MMNVEELKSRLANTGRTQNQIDEILNKFKKSIENRDAKNIQYKSTRNKLKELLKDYAAKDCRFFNWYPGLGVFVRRDGKKAVVSFSFLNHNDINADFVYHHRNDNYAAALNQSLNKYTYTVDWKGRSEFAAYDAWVANHYEFPSSYRKLSMGIDVTSFED